MIAGTPDRLAYFLAWGVCHIVVGGFLITWVPLAYEVLVHNLMHHGFEMEDVTPKSLENVTHPVQGAIRCMGLYNL